MKSHVKRKVVAGVGAVAVIGAAFTTIQLTSAQSVVSTAVYTVDHIPPRTLIDESMVTEREVDAEALPPTAHIELEDVIGKYTPDGYGIAANSTIHNDFTLEQSEMPDEAILNLEAGEYAFPLLVDLETSLGNSILPGAHVDLYFTTTAIDDDGEEKPMLGKIASHLRVTSAKDSSTADVFVPESQITYDDEESSSNNSNALTQARLYTFAASSQEEQEVLTKANLLGSIIPVVSGSSYDEEIPESQQSLDSISQTREWISENFANVSGDFSLDSDSSDVDELLEELDLYVDEEEEDDDDDE
ncbi:hypothetical protein DH09_00460 (plasmid) [Bacillaceae bacterium JMAK1]|nr:hypothetical protein DH09_00460 [Bacillaceae bacterium JMAK1]